MPPKRGLGRGLDALIPAAGRRAAPTGVAQLPIAAIGRNPRQPRARLNPTELEELANSIREHGVIQPLIVAQSAYPGQYTLDRRRAAAGGLAAGGAGHGAGHRARGQPSSSSWKWRWWRTSSASDLGPLETALAYKHLADDFGMSHEDIAARVGKKRVTVTNTMRLLKLPQRLLEALSAEEITEGHARVLLALSTAEAQLNAFAVVVRQGLSVRQTEELVRRLQGEKPRAPRRGRPQRRGRPSDQPTARAAEHEGDAAARARRRGHHHPALLFR